MVKQVIEVDGVVDGDEEDGDEEDGEDGENERDEEAAFSTRHSNRYCIRKMLFYFYFKINS